MRDDPYLRLRGRMLGVLLLFGLVPLIAAAAAGFVANQAASDARTRNLLEAMVKNRKVTIDLFLEEKLRQLEIMAATVPIERLSRPDTLEQLRAEMERRHGGFIDLGLIDQDGHHLAYVGPYALKDRDYHEEPWFREVMVRGHHESDVFLGFRRFPHMVMAVKKREAGRDYVLRATIDTDLLSSLVREGGLESGAEVFVLNRAGQFQTQYDARHELMEASDLGPVVAHSGVRVVERTGGGAREFVATVWLRDASWVLVARHRAAPLAALRDAHPAVIGVFLLGLLLIPTLSWFIARHRLRQIRELAEERTALFESVAQSEKMAAIGRMAASIAHEINNPLAIIHAQVGVLLDSVDASQPGCEEVRDRLAKVIAQIERGRRVTHRLLGFSRRVGPDEEPVDLAVALDETLGFIDKEAEASRVRIVRQYDPATPLVRTSLSQIQQVFLNLLNNALDALGHDGEIRLSVSPAEGGAEVSVEDTGPGIPERDLPRVFEPFFSTKAARDAKHSGLGLAICREIMTGLHGRISVESRPGRGTTFTLWFPRESHAAASPEEGPDGTATQATAGR